MTSRAAELETALADEEMTPEVRADTLMISVQNYGMDVKEPIVKLIKSADIGKAADEIKEFIERSKLGPLTMMKVAERYGNNTCLVIVNNCPKTVTFPPGHFKLKRGDWVAVTNEGIVVDEYEGFPETGDIATITDIAEDEVSCVVKVGAARIKLLTPEGLTVKKGDTVVYDKRQSFVLSILAIREEVLDMTVPVDDVFSINLHEIGSVHPILKEMTERMFAQIEHEDWFEKLNIRPTVSYMFSGPTGTGKSLHARLLARRLADRILEETGERNSRLVNLDASTLYSSYFGQTEQNITAFFDNLRLTAAETVGGKVYPLIVVMDEAEALLRSRGEGTSSSHLFDRPLSLILSKMQSVAEESECPITWITLTNRADMIDPAAMRRFGMRSVMFGSLPAEGAADILARKIGNLDIEGGKKRCVSKVIGELYGSSNGAFLNVHLRNGEKLTIRKADHVTGAMLEEGVSCAVDACFSESSAKNKLQRVKTENIQMSLDSQYESLQETARASNVKELFPHLLQEENQVISVSPVR